jgi:hypothetical protein
MITEEEKLSVSVKKMGIAEKNMILVPVRRRRSTKAEGIHGCSGFRVLGILQWQAAQKKIWSEILLAIEEKMWFYNMTRHLLHTCKAAAVWRATRWLTASLLEKNWVTLLMLGMRTWRWVRYKNM